MSGIWNEATDRLLREMAHSGFSLREIARKIGVSHVSVSRRTKVLGIVFRDGVAIVDLKPSKDVRLGDHLAGYKRARRGFHVPAHLESRYFDLLKAGVSIAEACRQLNINVNQQPEAINDEQRP